MHKTIVLFLLLFSHTCATAISSDSDISSKLDSYLNVCTDLGYFSGSVLVVKEGNTLLKKGYGQSNHEWGAPNTPQTKFRLSSLSKPFISLAIMQLQESGQLSINDRLSDYISDYPRGDEITIHHLLTHTSGIKNYTALPHFHTFKKLPHSIEEVIQQFKYLGLASHPGAVYKFSNSNYVLLSFIIERVTGQPHYEYITENIFKPIGMLNTGYDEHAAIIPDRASGYALDMHGLMNAAYIDVSSVIGLGSFYSTVEDMYLFNQALNTHTLVSQDSLQAMFMPYAQIGPIEDNIRYGYGWATILLAGHTVKKHIGGIDGFSTAMYRFPMNNSFIVVLSNFQHALTEPLSFDLAAIMYDKPYEMPVAHKEMLIDTRLYADYVGNYSLRGLIYTITQKDGYLYYKTPDDTTYRLIPESETQFFVHGIPIILRFVKNEQGNVTQLITKAFGKDRILIK